MAKISARGATKLASAFKDTRSSNPITGHEDAILRTRLALRSDGKVLRAVDILTDDDAQRYGSRGWNRGSYSIAQTLSASPSVTTVDGFRAYCESRGFTLR